MADGAAALDPVRAGRVDAVFAEELAVGVLRHAPPTDALQAAVMGVLGGRLPAALRAVSLPAARFEAPAMLVWSRPTETLVIGSRGGPFERLGGAARALVDAVFIDLSDGLCVLRLGGPGTPDLLSRLGAGDAVPAHGGATRRRLGDLPVLAVGRGGEGVWLVVERVYREHLMGWIRDTAADLRDPGARIRDI